MDKVPLYDNVPDESLGDLLYQLLIIDGHDEVEVKHPTEGMKIVTKHNYKKTLAGIDKINKLSPAKRFMESKRVKMAHQRKHRDGMKSAKYYTVDIQDDENFGTDINGVKFNMDDMVFLPVSDYLKGIKINHDNEFGAFVQPENKKEPIRILTIGNTDAEHNET